MDLFQLCFSFAHQNMEIKEDITNNGRLWGGVKAQEPSSISACHRLIKREHFQRMAN